MGDGGTYNGQDQGETRATRAEMINRHGAGYYSAIEAGVQTVMASYSSWDDVAAGHDYGKMHGSREMLTDVLKDRLGFDGLVVSDWNGIEQVQHFALRLPAGDKLGQHLQRGYGAIACRGVVQHDHVARLLTAYIDAVLDWFGWQNVVKAARYPSISVQELIELKPDRFFLSSEPYPFKTKHQQAFVAQLGAACEVRCVDGECFSWYGSRMRYVPNYVRSLQSEQNIT
jgi:hypothetical protein